MGRGLDRAAARADLDGAPGRRGRLGPAGLACAQQLARAGGTWYVFERDEAAGGLVRFGVPEFKIEKRLVERRVEQLVAEGVEFRFGVDVGGDVDVGDLRADFDAVVIATGARVPRDLPVPGRELGGVHFAMEYLVERARVIAGTATATISAAGHVVVIGGGDTGADCVGHAHREGAASVTQIELLGEPPPARSDELTPWPLWPMKLRTSYALKEGGARDFAISTTRFEGRDGAVERIVWAQNTGAPPFGLVPGTEESRPAELVLLAMGFLGPEPALLESLGVERDARGNVDGRELRHLVPRRVRGRRRASRPVADRVGDRRGPEVRPGRARLARRARFACTGSSFPFDSCGARSGVD